MKHQERNACLWAVAGALTALLTPLFIIFFLACLAEAAGLPFTKKSVTPDELAQALEDSDKSILNATCDEYVQAMQHFHPDAAIEKCADFVIYVRNLETKPFTQEKYVFWRLLINKSNRRLDFNWVRDLRPGELGLYDRNLQRFVASADCGNVGREIKKDVVVKKHTVQPVQYQPRRLARPMFAPSDVDMGTAYRPCPQGSDCWSANELAGHVIDQAGFVAGMAALRPPRYRQSIQNNNEGVNSTSGATATNTNDIDVSSDADATSTSEGGAGGVGMGGAGGQGGVGGRGGAGGNSHNRNNNHNNPSPPPGEPEDPGTPPLPPPPPVDPGTPPPPPGPIDPGTPPPTGDSVDPGTPDPIGDDGGGPSDPGSGPADPGS